MSTPHNPPAFPMPSGPEPRQNETTHYNEGMLLRDWFAAAALQGLLAHNPEAMGSREFAIAAYAHADAMLAERIPNPSRPR